MQNFYLSKNEALDSVQNWKENSEQDWVKCVQDLIQSKPFGDHKFYIFMFVKRVNDITGEKKMYHQPRLTKPEPVPGTTLLRVNPLYPEEATIIWTLPNQETFNLYKEGKMFADEFVSECIDKYLNNPRELMKPEEGDLPDKKIRELWISYLKRLKEAKRRISNALRDKIAI